ncbi:hypothetical protein DCAR_0312631 [Daucus carota subsp. sativus]|uniref:Uncharacterized protein n=1 Tax=Daucus carota subsp. sativus TaxID=79200 RepID=A0A166B693_DAUCS|nr:PREDICTED: thioredoxin H2 [Daucus carota subsp. sativus]WOG93348.1 hypothetical protein DCAR_0312631 [Daucus carota subsp. sativus]
MGGFLSSLLGGDAATAAEYPPSTEPSRVLEFHSADRWRLHFNSAKQSPKLMVIDFSAKWCGPCKMMEPALRGMADKYPNVDFIKIDVDELSDVAREFGVQAMPTLVLMKQGKEIERIIGAKTAELESKINKHRELPKFAA